MKITIIETGLPPEPLRADWPGYPTMFETLIARADAGFAYAAVSPVKGEAFPDPAALDAVLVTGSPSGVYDDEPWMAGLMDFIRWTAAATTPMAGICFGHQAIAHALGGRAELSDKGWGVGRHAYEVADAPRWAAGAPAEMAFAVSHRDQVTAPPPGARTVLRSQFTPYAGLVYDTAPILSFQGHPEFSDDYAAALYEARRERLTPALADTALASLRTPEHNGEAARWLASFFRASARA